MTTTNLRTTADATALHDPPLPVKARLAAGWTSLMFFYIYVDHLNLYKPGVVEELLAGRVFEFEANQTFVIVALTLVGIPAVMVVLSAALPARVNRPLNLVVGGALRPRLAVQPERRRVGSGSTDWGSGSRCSCSRSSSVPPGRGRARASRLSRLTTCSPPPSARSSPSRAPRVRRRGRGGTGSWSACMLVVALGEAVLRPDLPMRPLAVAVALVVIPALLWRRTHPLAATAVGFGGALVLQLPMLLGDGAEVGLDSMVVVLLLPYSLYRWASGRDALVGTAIIAVPVVLGSRVQRQPR